MPKIASATAATNNTDPRTMAATSAAVLQFSDVVSADVVAVTVAAPTVTVDVAVIVGDAADDPEMGISGGGKLEETICDPPVSLTVALFELQQARALLS